MLSYQHGYHAGSFADVLKHISLCLTLSYLSQKDKPFLYLETHAGRGLYDLHDPKAQKTGEYQQGIQCLWEKKNEAPRDCAAYLAALEALNPAANLRYYPGSPYLAYHALRSSDKLICAEKHPREFEALSQRLPSIKRRFFHHGDGLTLLNTLLPPPERRALVFIDPSYEQKEEYKTIPRHLDKAYKRFASGVYCLWYPIVHPQWHAELLRGLAKIAPAKSLRIELCVSDASKPGMTGCGLWFINPPFSLANSMDKVCRFLCTLFNSGKSSYLIED